MGWKKSWARTPDQKPFAVLMEDETDPPCEAETNGCIAVEHLRADAMGARLCSLGEETPVGESLPTSRGQPSAGTHLVENGSLSKS